MYALSFSTPKSNDMKLGMQFNVSRFKELSPSAIKELAKVDAFGLIQLSFSQPDVLDALSPLFIHVDEVGREAILDGYLCLREPQIQEVRWLFLGSFMDKKPGFMDAFISRLHTQMLGTIISSLDKEKTYRDICDLRLNSQEMANSIAARTFVTCYVKTALVSKNVAEREERLTLLANKDPEFIKNGVIEGLGRLTSLECDREAKKALFSWASKSGERFDLLMSMYK